MPVEERLFARLPLHVHAGQPPTEGQVVGKVLKRGADPACWCLIGLVVVVIAAIVLVRRLTDSLDDAEHDQDLYAIGSPPPPVLALLSPLSPMTPPA